MSADLHNEIARLHRENADLRGRLDAVLALCDKETPPGWSATRAFVYVNDLRTILDGPTP